MPFSLSITVDGQHELDVALSRAADTLDDLTKYWPQVADAFYEIEKEQFSSEGARAGTPWARLSPAYAAAKQRYFDREDPFSDNKILRRTGALRRSLTSRDPVTSGAFGLGGEYGGNSIYEPAPDSLTLGSSLPYAVAHQRGNPSTHQPARPPIDLKAEDARRMRKAFRDQIAKEVKRAGWPVDLSDYRSDVAAVTDEIDEDMSMF